MGSCRHCDGTGVVESFRGEPSQGKDRDACGPCRGTGQERPFPKPTAADMGMGTDAYWNASADERRWIRRAVAAEARVAELEALLDKGRDFPGSPAWTSHPAGCRFKVLVVHEDDGGFSAVALNLPGVGSCGRDEEEAVQGFKEAARLALADYGDSIPWLVPDAEEEVPARGRVRWIMV